MKENEPLLFIDSPTQIKKTKKVVKADVEEPIIKLDLIEENKFTKIIDDLEALAKKGIKTICSIKTKKIIYEGYYIKAISNQIYIDDKIFDLEHVKEINVIKFEKN